MPDMTFQERWQLHVQVIWGREPTTAGWRRKLGRLLRRAADRVDGRRSLAVQLETTPAISAAALHGCFKRGAIAIEQAAEAELRLEAQERILRRAHPELFGERAL
jgi:hypothetical protein